MEIKLKDFILSEIPEPEFKEKRTRSATEYNFSIEYENDSDFILKKTTQKTEKLLVVLISQAQIYIKDVKQNTIESVTDVSQISKFKIGMSDLPVFNVLVWKPFENRGYYSTDLRVNNIFEDIITHKETFKILSNKKLNPFANPELIRTYERDPENFRKMNEILKVVHLIDPAFSASCYEYDVVARNIKDGNIQYNTINANMDLINELGKDTFLNILKSNQLFSVLTEYLCDFKSFLKFCLYTIKYRNGLRIGNYYEFAISQYVDYLRMQQEMYGKVKEKYPLYWLSEKQMMNNKYNKWKEMRRIEGFDLGQESMKQYEYDEDNVFTVIIPLKSTDILDEAQQQQHCVASYINRISRGETHIVFIRQKLNVEESCLTVEITPDGRVVQVRGFQNRDYTGLEYSFMKKWAEAKNLKLEVREIV